MKKFIQKVQDLSQKANQMKQALQSAPAKAAEIREAVAAAAGQLHQLRADVQSSVNSLRTDGDDRLTHALREVDQSHDIFKEAGYAVLEVEMELGLAQRLVVHLEKMEDVPHDTIRSLLSANDSRKTTHAILAALLKAEELADHVSLNNLTYHKLTVYAGLTPCVRLCWGAPLEETTQHVAPVVAAATIHPPPLPAASAFSQSSYFERAAPPTTPVAVAITAPTPAAEPPKPSNPHETKEAAPPAGDFGRSALERFKKMPDLSKYRR